MSLINSQPISVQSSSVFPHQDKTLQRARSILELEAAEVALLAQRLDQQFADAVQCILLCKGRVVVSGMGKSGHIGGKIASTLIYLLSQFLN